MHFFKEKLNVHNNNNIIINAIFTSPYPEKLFVPTLPTYSMIQADLLPFTSTSST
jgi:hypothetical protein